MTAEALQQGPLQQGQQRLVSDRYEGLISSGNRPVTPDEQLRGERSRRVADYLAAVRDREKLPPHAYPAGVFTDVFPASDIAALAKKQGEGMAPLAPVAPIAQGTSLIDPSSEDQPWLQPDLGRRVQLWWDELAPGHPPLRADEIVRFIPRGSWRGRVETVLGERFAARVWDRAHPGTEERVEFFVAQLSPGDRERLAEGVALYWTVGYAENAIGERTSASRVRLKRVRPTFPPELHAERAQAAEALLAALDLPPDGPQ